MKAKNTIDFCNFIWQMSKTRFIFAPARMIATNGALAQLVEQRTENPCVPGSIPGGTTAKPEHLFGFFVFPMQHNLSSLVFPV